MHGRSIAYPASILRKPDQARDQDTRGGGFEADEAWAGAMDNLRIYDRPRSAAEIQQRSEEPHS